MLDEENLWKSPKTREIISKVEKSLELTLVTNFEEIDETSDFGDSISTREDILEEYRLVGNLAERGAKSMQFNFIDNLYRRFKFRNKEVLDQKIEQTENQIAKLSEIIGTHEDTKNKLNNLYYSRQHEREIAIQQAEAYCNVSTQLIDVANQLVNQKLIQERENTHNSRHKAIYTGVELDNVLDDMELADRNWESGLKCIHYGIKELILYEKDRNVASKLLSNTKNFIRNSKLYVNHIRNMKSGLDHAEQIRSFIGEIEKIGIDMKQEFDEMQQDYEKQLDKIHNEYDSKLRYNGPTFKQSPEGRLKSLKELHETTMQMVTPKKYQMKAV